MNLGRSSRKKAGLNSASLFQLSRHSLLFESFALKHSCVCDRRCNVPGKCLEEADAFRRKRIHLRVLDVENADQLAADLKRNINLRTGICLAGDIERNFPDIGRVESLAACCGMSAHTGLLTNLEAGAFQAKFSAPACGNHKFVGVVLFQEHRETVITKSVRHIAYDLIKECVEVEYGVDLLCYTLQQIEFFNSQNFIEKFEGLCCAVSVEHRGHRDLRTCRPFHEIIE